MHRYTNSVPAKNQQCCGGCASPSQHHTSWCSESRLLTPGVWLHKPTVPSCDQCHSLRSTAWTEQPKKKKNGTRAGTGPTNTAISRYLSSAPQIWERSAPSSQMGLRKSHWARRPWGGPHRITQGLCNTSKRKACVVWDIYEWPAKGKPGRRESQVLV